jgi:hypothetical protein
MKLASLHTYEIARQQQQQLADSHQTKQDDSYMAKMLVKILENLVVSISRIHIRFEEDGVVAAGAALRKFEIRTSSVAGGTAKPGSAKATFKDVELTDLSVYCDVNNPTETDHTKLTHEQWIEQMRNGIGAARTDPIHQYILEPTCGLAKLEKAPPGATSDDAKMKAEVHLDRIALSLSSFQYQGVCKVTQQFTELQNKAAHFKVSNQRSKIGSLRPTSSQTACRLWWIFVIDSVLDQVRERQKWKENNGVSRRVQYMNLYKRSQKEVTWLPKLTKEEQKVHF